MSTPFSSASAAIEALWSTTWPGAETAPILWHHNTNEPVPARGTTDHWLHIAIEFDGETVRAFGGGRSANERELEGTIVIRVLAGRGLGEAEQLRLLDAAMAVFRGKRSGALSVIGDSVLHQPGASADGAWWVRSGIAAFVYRFQG